jgi:hypothetical protein
VSVPSVGDIATIGVLGFVAVRLAGGLRHATGPGRSLTIEIVRGIGWRHVWPVPFVLAAVVTVAGLLVAVPGLDVGWWTALGGTGNPVTGGAEVTTGTAWEWIVPVAFLTMLLPAVPLFAHAEERIFRGGAESQSVGRRAWRTLQFGLVHVVVGIPIGVALALTVGGAWFLHVYVRSVALVGRRGATLESARAHAAYNGVIVVLVLIAIAAAPYG